MQFYETFQSVDDGNLAFLEEDIDFHRSVSDPPPESPKPRASKISTSRMEEPMYVYASEAYEQKASHAVRKFDKFAGMQFEEKVQQQDKPRGAKLEKQPLSGVVSAGQSKHPWGCTECQFYYFSPEGCKNGADCLYCHAVHPRKNARKNRRLLNRMRTAQAQAGELEEVASTPAVVAPKPPKRQHEKGTMALPLQNLNMPVMVNEMPIMVKAPPGNNALQGTTYAARRGNDLGASLLAQSAPPGLTPSPEAVLAALTSNVAAKKNQAAQMLGMNQTPADAQAAPKPSLQMLSYTGATEKESTQNLTFIVGIRTRIAAHLEVDPDTWRNLEDRAVFTVQPPLPNGLVIDPCSGLISGLPMQNQESASEHIVYINIAQIDPSRVGNGRLSFNNVTLTACSLSVRVVDVHMCSSNPKVGYSMTHAQQKNNQLVLTFQGP